MGSGCSSVGRAVASDSRGPQVRIQSSTKNILNIFVVNCIEKAKIKKKRPGLAHFVKKDPRYTCLGR